MFSLVKKQPKKFTIWINDVVDIKKGVGKKL